VYAEGKSQRVRNAGVLEYWSVGFLIYPLLRHSITPSFHC
jgi:hypothetical protein